MCRLENSRNLIIVQFGINEQAWNFPEPNESAVWDKCAVRNKYPNLDIFPINTTYPYLHVVVLSSVQTQNNLIAH